VEALSRKTVDNTDSFFMGIGTTIRTDSPIAKEALAGYHRAPMMMSRQYIRRTNPERS
jgi:hypothetical protein